MTRRILALLMALVMVFALAACGESGTQTSTNPTDPASEPTSETSPGASGAIDVSSIDGISDGVLTVGMECAYAPYNWTQMDDSNGAVPISNVPGSYANGYDVQIAQYVANRLGLKLEIYAMEWDSLIPAVNSGAIDAIVAGMSPTAERSEQLDFTDTYYESNLVVIIRK